MQHGYLGLKIRQDDELLSSSERERAQNCKRGVIEKIQICKQELDNESNA
jgi:hypothetical protein